MRGPGRAAGGFTLAELLVAFAIAGVGLLIAGRLLLESQLRLSHSARRALEPATTIALKQIRADVRASARLEAADFEWSRGPLVLSGHPAGEIRYQRLGTDLVRRVASGSGAAIVGRRIVLPDVAVWRWRLHRSVPLPLLEVEIGRREIPLVGALAAGGQREAALPVLVRHRIAVSPRMAEGKSGW